MFEIHGAVPYAPQQDALVVADLFPNDLPCVMGEVERLRDGDQFPFLDALRRVVPGVLLKKRFFDMLPGDLIGRFVECVAVVFFPVISDGGTDIEKLEQTVVIRRKKASCCFCLRGDPAGRFFAAG